MYMYVTVYSVDNTVEKNNPSALRHQHVCVLIGLGYHNRVCVSQCVCMCVSLFCSTNICCMLVTDLLLFVDSVDVPPPPYCA